MDGDKDRDGTGAATDAADPGPGFAGAPIPWLDDLVGPVAAADDRKGQAAPAGVAAPADPDPTTVPAPAEPPAQSEPPAETPVATPPVASATLAPKAPKHHARGARRRRGSGLGARLFLLGLAVLIAFSAFGLTGKTLRLPVWAVAEVETRLNRAAGSAMPDGALSIGGIELTVDDDWTPRFRLEDVRLLRPGGQSLLALPDVRVALDPGALVKGQVRARSLRLVGGKLALARDADGRFDLSLGLAGQGPGIDSLGAFFEAAEAAFARPGLAFLNRIEAEALTLTLSDARAGRVWEVGDGRLTVENRGDELAAELGLSLVSGGTPAQAVLTVISQRGAATARITATVQDVAAADLAVQAAPLAWAQVLDAPISGQLVAELDATGIVALEGRLSLGAGALRPRAETRPITFERAALSLSYDPARGRINLTELSVESASLRLRARGQSYLIGADGQRLEGALAGQLPASFLGQLAFDQVMVDPEGLFAQPVRFSGGALDLRLRLDPFGIDIGQLSLTDEGRRLTARGLIGADAGGWRTAVDIGLNEITRDPLLSLWPVTLVPKTRAWVGANVLEGTLRDVKVALRVAPGTETRLSLGYDFDEAQVRFVRTLPEVREAAGYSTIEGQTYTVVLSRGVVVPPEGGPIDMAGSVFRVPDVTRLPALGEVRLKTRSSLTAALSLLDQPPFGFLTKAGRPVVLGEGTAELDARLELPLVGKVGVDDVRYDVSGTIRDLTSTLLVPGKTITAPALRVVAGNAGMRVSGPGRIGAVPFDVAYSQPFGPGTDGQARIDGAVTLGPGAVAEFGLGLPEGMVTGEAQASVGITLPKGAPARMALSSDLMGLTLRVPEVGWTKPARSAARLEAGLRLGAPMQVDRLTLSGAGLEATGGRVTLRAGGGLDTARFDRVTLAGWLDAPVEISGRGPGRPVGLALTGGVVDMRRMGAGIGAGGGGRAGSPLSLRLDRLQVTDSIAFTGFRASFSGQGGLNGDFVAQVNGTAPVQGTISPVRGGNAIRIRATDAGAVLAAAGIFSSGRGGSLDLQLTPRGPEGHYNGRADIRSIRVRNASVLAELLSAISVVGLLEQLDGEGILFAEADADFILTPQAIEVTRGAAVGASLGVSMAGVYITQNKRLALQGVISPIYLVNSIGAMLTRRAEGWFGFNYTLGGTADKPQISVNPLSILTPGMFRDIFRRPPPALPRGNG